MRPLCWRRLSPWLWPDAPPGRGQQLHLVRGEYPREPRPADRLRPEDVLACKNLYGGLVRLDAGGQPQPDLAERWTVSPDGLTYTFTLKPGLTYRASRGEQTDYAITAEDFVYAFQRMFSAK